MEEIMDKGSAKGRGTTPGLRWIQPSITSQTDLIAPQHQNLSFSPDLQLDSSINMYNIKR